MIDAQGAGVAHVDPVEVREAAIAVGAQPVRIERRQAPHLSQRSQRIGRGADRDPLRQPRPFRPGLGAVGRGADGKITAEAELEPRRLTRRLGQLPFAQPLHIVVEAQPVRVRRREGPHAVAIGVLKLRRPGPPALTWPTFTDRLEGREAPQGLAAGGDEGGEFRRGLERRETGL